MACFMGVGKLPETEVTISCSDKVTADVIQKQIRNRGTEFAITSDADLLRAASKWVSDQCSWLLCDLQLVVYGRTCSWVFYTGSRSNQVAFHATAQNIEEPKWERWNWKACTYSGCKGALMATGKVLAIGAPVAAFIPAYGPAISGGMAAAGAAATTLSTWL